MYRCIDTSQMDTLYMHAQKGNGDGAVNMIKMLLKKINFIYQKQNLFHAVLYYYNNFQLINTANKIKNTTVTINSL